MKFYVQGYNEDAYMVQLQRAENWILIHSLSFEIHGTNEYTCPVEHLAVFAHDFDLDYEQVIQN